MSPLFGVLASFGSLHAPQQDAAMGEAAGEFIPAPALSRTRIQDLVTRLDAHLRDEVLPALALSHARSAARLEDERQRLVRATAKLSAETAPGSRAALTLRGTADQLMVRLMAAADEGALAAPHFEVGLAHVQALRSALAQRG
ncbi:MAG TPA: hypothetical protein VHF69_09040 [Candidatus Synoicihabitans sp.]|nr:hypothetical protein [Candidatus Synoicihabitans sp.]